MLCEENGTELVLVKAPSLYPYWYDEYDEQISKYAMEHGISFYNFVEKSDEIGLDFSRDTYDGGYHLNVFGAVKLSQYFGDILATEYGLEDHRQEPAIADIYNKKLEIYDATITERMRNETNEKNR